MLRQSSSLCVISVVLCVSVVINHSLPQRHRGPQRFTEKPLGRNLKLQSGKLCRGRAGDVGIHHEVQRFDDVWTHLAPVEDGVDHSVTQKKLGSLKVFRQLLTDGLFDHAWTGKAYQGL